MTDAELVELMMTAVRTQLRQPDLRFEPGTAYRSLPGFDSVLSIQLMLGLEATFGIELDEDEVERMMTLGDTAAVLRARLPTAA